MCVWWVCDADTELVSQTVLVAVSSVAAPRRAEVMVPVTRAQGDTHPEALCRPLVQHILAMIPHELTAAQLLCIVTLLARPLTEGSFTFK